VKDIVQIRDILDILITGHQFIYLCLLKEFYLLITLALLVKIESGIKGSKPPSYPDLTDF